MKYLVKQNKLNPVTSCESYCFIDLPPNLCPGDACPYLCITNCSEHAYNCGCTTQSGDTPTSFMNVYDMGTT